MESKKAQNLSTTTIILIILGLVVLVVLILGFTKGWSNIGSWLSGSDTQQISSQCSVACATQNTYDWCTQTRGSENKNCSAYAAEGKANPCPAISCTGGP